MLIKTSILPYKYFALESIFLVICILILKTSSKTCKFNDCQCRFSNGSVINLKPIASENDFPRFSFLESKDQTLLFYDPCKTFNLTVNSHSDKSCSNVLGCKVFPSSDSKNVSVTPLIDLSSKVNFSANSIIYRTKDKIQLIVNLECDDKAINHRVTVNNNNASELQLTLTSKCVCYDLCKEGTPDKPEDKSLSTGSILLIITFTLFITYIVAGIIWNGVCQGAVGMEVLPNIEFWKDFPNLVMEGAAYSVSCCRNQSTYDRV